MKFFIKRKTRILTCILSALIISSCFATSALAAETTQQVNDDVPIYPTYTESSVATLNENTLDWGIDLISTESADISGETAHSENEDSPCYFEENNNEANNLDWGFTENQDGIETLASTWNITNWITMFGMPVAGSHEMVATASKPISLKINLKWLPAQSIRIGWYDRVKQVYVWSDDLSPTGNASGTIWMRTPGTYSFAISTSSVIPVSVNGTYTVN